MFNKFRFWNSTNYSTFYCHVSFSTFSRVHFLISPLFFSRQYETVVPLEDSVVTEVTATLQEWAVLWKQLYVVRAVSSPCVHISDTLGGMMPALCIQNPSEPTSELLDYLYLMGAPQLQNNGSCQSHMYCSGTFCSSEILPSDLKISLL